MKLENIMITKGIFIKATLIDFGYATKFMDKNNNHLDQKKVGIF